jgi:hypothetical protein
MAISKNRTLRVRILVKAFPQPSKAHEETVCCAGISEDGTELLRLFPIRFRRLPKEHQFERFDLVQMTATKASDPRPESYRVDEASIRLLERDTLSDEAKVRLWQPFIAPSLKELYADNRATNRSLGIFKPDPDSIKFTVKPAKDAYFAQGRPSIHGKPVHGFVPCRSTAREAGPVELSIKYDHSSMSGFFDSDQNSDPL